MDNLAVLFCLSQAAYPTKPGGISEAELVDCPYCKKKMWFSEKKKIVKKLCEELGKNILFCCSDCLDGKLKEMTESGEITNLDEFKQVKL